VVVIVISIIITVIIITIMWNVKAYVIPLITDVTESISKSFRQCLSNIPGKHEIKQRQTTIFGTVHLLRKVLL
jgi:hypothetical protein